MCEFATSDTSVLRRHKTRHESESKNLNTTSRKKRSVRKKAIANSLSSQLNESMSNLEDNSFSYPIVELQQNESQVAVAFEQDINVSNGLVIAKNDTLPLLVLSEDSSHHNIECNRGMSSFIIDSSGSVAGPCDDAIQLEISTETFQERNPPPQLVIIADDMIQVNAFISRINERHLLQHKKQEI